MKEKEYLTKEIIIQNILAKSSYFPQNKEKKENYPEKGYILFEYGTKVLELGYEFDSNGIVAVTFIKSKNDENEHKPEETTLLYEAAKQTMQKLSNNFKRLLHYQMITADKKMLAWAQTTGRNLFHWESEEHTETEAQRFSVTIYPNL